MLKDILKSLMEKKKIIGIVSALLIGVIAGVLGMSSEALKEAICTAPTVELPKIEAPAGVVAPTGAVGVSDTTKGPVEAPTTTK